MLLTLRCEVDLAHLVGRTEALGKIQNCSVAYGTKSTKGGAEILVQPEL
jgi:hypothetical protein